MSAPADIWTPHLAAGERVLWSASISPALVKASRDRQRLIAVATGLSAAILAALLAFRTLESFFPAAPPPPGSMNVFGPVYAVFALAMGVYAASRFARLNPARPAVAHYGVTTSRVLALGPSGAVVDAVAGGEIDDVRALDITRPPSLVVSRKDDLAERRALIIAFVERPLEAKAIIEDTLIPPAPEEPAP